MKRLIILFLALLLTACGTGNESSPPRPVNVYATDAARPWLAELYACAVDLSVVLNVSAESPDILLRLGEPQELTTSAFQIDVEDILIVVNTRSPLQNLTLEQAREIFSGRDSPSVQVWAYASAIDVQEVFDTAVMNGRGVTSYARLAVGPAHMSEALFVDGNAVGILPRHWLREGLRDLFVAASIPVLAVTASEPEGSVRDLMVCLQK